MSTWKIIGGVIIGVGAVAAVPFTGGGSLLGVTTLAASLTGAAGTATAAGVIGGGAGAILNEGEKKRKKKAEGNHFKEGVMAGEAAVKEKFNSFLKTLKRRDEFMLLIVKVGVYVAKCDGVFSKEERIEIDSFKGEINTSPVVPEQIRRRIDEILNSNILLQEIVMDTKQLLEPQSDSSRKELLKFLDNFIQRVVYSDGVYHQKEEEFIVQWNKEFRYNG
jgi:uncharacterized membrane protein YebE (DUF533 family)